MVVASNMNVDAIWDHVRQWPADAKLSLASKILESVRDEKGGMKQHALTLADLRGLMSSGQTPPSDVQVEQWLEEERLRKFG